jgi:hypothetical protein
VNGAGGERQDEQRDRRQHEAERAGERELAPLGAIRHMPRIQSHRNERHRLGQPDQAQRQRVAREGEHLPPHDDDLRLARERERAVGHEQPAEVGDAQRRVWRDGQGTKV